MENDDFIGIYEDSAPQELCDELVKWFDLCSDKNFTYHNMPFSDGTRHNTLKSDESVSVPISHFSLPGELCNAFWETLTRCFNEYAEKYDLNEMRLSCHTFKLHKVKECQGYHIWHHENNSCGITGRRALAWMTYLKVPEEGGETEFLHQSKRIKPVVGRTLIWPAYFTHLHRGNPPLKGEKYYITGWFERD